MLTSGIVFDAGVLWEGNTCPKYVCALWGRSRGCLLKQRLVSWDAWALSSGLPFNWLITPGTAPVHVSGGECRVSWRVDFVVPAVP